MERLCALQQSDGGWPASPILRVPRSYPIRHDNRAELYPDTRRLFTTATAVRALSLLLEGQRGVDLAGGSPSPLAISMQSSSDHRPRRDEFAPIVREAAVVVGFSRSAAADVERLFTSLTRRSLAPPSPWPSEQLSSLSGGVPLEFSAVLAEQERWSLRYATEVGAPYLPPRQRALSGLRVLGAVASAHGLARQWRRVHRALAGVTARSASLPVDLRFGVWGGIDQSVDSWQATSTYPKLKVYLNVLHSADSPGLPRIVTGLAAAQIPLHPRTLSVLDHLNEVGFPQEIGFRIGPEGEWDCKVYFELPGWRRDVTESVLTLLGWPSECDALVPEIPGVLRESLARKERSGLSLRIDTRTGAPLELTSTAAFPPPMKSPESIRKAVLAWAEREGWASEGYAKLSAYLLRSWQRSPSSFGRLHSIFTRTLSPSATYATVYLRPFIPDSK